MLCVDHYACIIIVTIVIIDIIIHIVTCVILTVAIIISIYRQTVNMTYDVL
uniref:Uncharacterized protein n=1 Tax=Amphimedon queenslandica TaxID=400682 RepID=A0A1X7VSC2_AMPQE